MCAPDAKPSSNEKKKNGMKSSEKCDSASRHNDNEYNAPARSRRRHPDTSNMESGETLEQLYASPSSLSKESLPSTSSSRRKSSLRCHSFTEASTLMTAGTLMSFFFVVLASYLPFFMAPSAAEATYQLAGFDYHADLSLFDNTILTYGTDYALALVMGIIIWSYPQTKRGTASQVVSFRSQAMLLCYLLSVLAGGLAHHFYTTMESRGHWSFRLLWTVCVGTVTVVPAYMGSVGTELVHADWESRNIDDKTTTGRFFSIDEKGGVVLPVIPAWLWAAFGVCSTLIVALGGMSYQRPACDIFVAGITQTPSTFYVMATLALGLSKFSVPRWTRVVGCVGFILNAPLLPLYPLLVQYTDWSLGAVNTLLHTVLMISWSTQGICLRQLAIALEEHESIMEADAVNVAMPRVREDPDVAEEKKVA